MFLPQPVAQAVGRKFDIVEGQQDVFGDGALERAAFGETDRQQVLCARRRCVFGQPVGHVAAQAVDHGTSLKVNLGRGNHFNTRPAQRCQRRITEEHGACNRIGHFEVAQVIRGVETIERPGAHFVKRQIVLLLGVVVCAQHKHARPGHRAHHVVDDTRAFCQRAQRVQVGDLLDGRIGRHRGTEHAALPDAHARAVGDDGVFKRYLGAVGKRRDHGRVLAPLAGKPFLRRRIAVGVMQALDIAAQHRLDPDALDEAVQVHHHAGLVAVGAGQHHARAVGVGLQDRPDRAVDLGVHQHHMLAVRDSL